MEIIELSPERNGFDFIPREFLPPGKDEYWQRDLQAGLPRDAWRSLTSFEIEQLVKNGNSCSDWSNVLVRDPFDPILVKNCNFHGLVRIGVLKDVCLQHHDFIIATGLRNSTIVSCDIGDNCAIQGVSYLAHYILRDHVILYDVDEMHCSNHAKFGNGIVTVGESEDVRIWIDVMNEAGGRSILPFEDLICADAYLWAAYRDDAALVRRLAEITQADYAIERGVYGEVGAGSVIKSTRIVKDVKVGANAYIKGANKLKNLSVLSSEKEPTQIGEGVELVNGIIGYGCRIFYGCKAVRFVMGRNSNLKYGARLIHSVLGDNSTVSCCEMLNNLVYPAHEQHHNNSFLIASLVQGLSNMAAGATVGSNHNSRAPDGEIRAGRGFWPGLCVTLKHSSVFASYVLIAKGDYAHELIVPFPFALVNNDVAKDRLEIMPAYFWMYNMYALERNSWKAAARDKRAVKVQRIDAEYLAPDTVEEILRAMELIQIAVAKARLRADGKSVENATAADLAAKGKALLETGGAELDLLEVLADGVERSSRPVVIQKARRAWKAYRHMARFYATSVLLERLETAEASSFAELSAELPGERERDWVNLGGQIVSARRVDDLRARIGAGALHSWKEIHAEYEAFAEAYPDDRARHAFAVLSGLQGKRPNEADFLALLDQAVETRRWISEQVFLCRAKDHRDRFRAATYRNQAEMQAVLGTAEGNSFVKQARAETEAFERRVAALRTRLGRK